MNYEWMMEHDLLGFGMFVVVLILSLLIDHR